jgi:hypothetical protein
MKTLFPSLLFVLLTPLLRALAESPPEPGPESGGLRMRLVVTPRSEIGKDGYDVRLDLINVSGDAIILRADWGGLRGSDGDLQAFVEAATSIETWPVIAPWIGQVAVGTPKSPEPEQVLPAGETLTLKWQTDGRRLKNKVSDPNAVQNPEFPTPGLYSVHATLVLPITDRTVLLRSNEQLVPIGGSNALPKHTYGALTFVDPEKKTAQVNLGSLHKIELGDEFRIGYRMGDVWKLTVSKVELRESTGALDLLSPAGVNPARQPLTPLASGLPATLIPKKPADPASR